MTTVLLIESKHTHDISFALHLKKRYEVLIAHTGRKTLAMARDKKPDIIVIDAASLRTSGDRICLSLKNALADIPIIHIKQATESRQANKSKADLVLYMPFTYRKLWNRIERYIVPDTGTILKAGNFELNVELGLLTTPEGEKKLTPRLVKLMEIFMRYPGQVIERRQFMKDIWQTDYMGDTRTLDVHIRWLRQAIEKTPGKPQLIQTVRGKGYILRLPD